MTSTLHLVVRFIAKKGSEKELRKLLFSLVEPTLEEDGCLRYQLLWNHRDSAEFTFIEEWRDEAALQAHAESEHVSRARDAYPPLLGADIAFRSYSAVR